MSNEISDAGEIAAFDVLIVDVAAPHAHDATLPRDDARETDAGLDTSFLSPDADRREREDATGFCRPDGTCVCFEEGWGVCAGSDTICIDLTTDVNCGRCGRDCTDTTYCRYVGAGCVCQAGACEASELVDWWPSFGYLADGFFKNWNASYRFPVRPTDAVVTQSTAARWLYVADGVAHRSVERTEGDDDSIEWVPVPTEDRIRTAYIAYGHGYMIAESDHVYFTYNALTPVWRTDDLGASVADVCLMHDDNALLLLADGRVLATGTDESILGTGGVRPSERGLVEVRYPRSVVSLACNYSTSVAILDDGTAWFTGDRALPGVKSVSIESRATVPEAADLRLTRRFERVFSIPYGDGRMFCVAGSELAGGYGCWGRFGTVTWGEVDPVAFLWASLPRSPYEVREGSAGICGRFDVGFGREEIRCVAGFEPGAVALLMWSNARIGT